jgi:hypothetical protein
VDISWLMTRVSGGGNMGIYAYDTTGHRLAYLQIGLGSSGGVQMSDWTGTAQSTLSSFYTLSNSVGYRFDWILDLTAKTHTLRITNLSTQGTASSTNDLPGGSSYDKLIISTTNSATAKLAFDDITVAVPEPGTLGMLGGAGLLLLGKRRPAR